MPPETNSSISTVGRRAPTFEVEGRTYRFQFTEGRFSFEVLGDEDGCKLAKKFTKKDWIKVQSGMVELDKVIESWGDCDSLSDLVEYYVYGSDHIEGYGFWRH